MFGIATNHLSGRGVLQPEVRSLNEAKEEEIRVDDLGRMLASHTLECIAAFEVSDEGKLRALLAVISRLRDRAIDGRILKAR